MVLIFPNNWAWESLTLPARCLAETSRQFWRSPALTCATVQMVRIFNIWPFQSTSCKQRKDPQNELWWDALCSRKPSCYCRKLTKNPCSLFYRTKTLCSCLNRALVCLFLCRRWRRWTWTSGRTSGGHGPGRIPGTIRTSSGADRTNRAELHGRGADPMAEGGASGSSENRLCFVLDQVLLAFGSKQPTSDSFGLFVPKRRLLAADCSLWTWGDYLRKQPVGGASVSMNSMS